MDSAGTMMQMGGLGMGVMGSVMQGRAAKGEAAFEAGQYRQRESLDVAAGQRAGMTQAEHGRAVEGQARAIGAAAGGGGASTTATIADIMNKTRLNQAGELFKGQVAATSDENAARAALARGKNAQAAANINAWSRGLSGFGQIASRQGLFNNKGTTILDDNYDSDSGWRTTTSRVG